MGAFHQGFVYKALCQHFGREADYRHSMGLDGYYEWIWDATEAEKADRWQYNKDVTNLEVKAGEIIEWLGMLGLDPQTHVCYGFHGFPRHPSMKEHRVLVCIHVRKDEAEQIKDDLHEIKRTVNNLARR